MVKRYFGEDPEEEKQFNFEDGIYDEDEDEEGEENVAYMTTDDFMGMMQMDLAQTELNQHLLGKAIEIAQQSFFWRFRSTAWKMQTIKRIYRDLVEMTEDEEEDKEGEQ
jgi:hypothetical protein